MATKTPDYSFALTASVQTWPLDVTTDQSRFLVEVGDDYRFEVSSGVYHVIESLREGCATAEQLARKLHARGFEDATPEKISRLIRKVLIPRRIVEPPPGEEFEEYTPVEKRSSYLRIKLPLVGPETLRPITGILRHLFDRRLMAVMLAVIAAAHFVFYTRIFGDFEWAVAELPLADWAVLLLAMNLGAIFHELGHATACRYYDCPHGKIGWGIYIFMFVLYTDVSPAWRLPRKQRAVVDFAGMYFELIFASAALGFYLWTAHTHFAYLFLLLNLNVVTSLNPVLRQDGYWLVSDLSGQANLRDANLAMLRGWWQRLFRRGEAETASAPSATPKWLQLTIQIYTVLTVLFSAVFVFWIARWVSTDIVPALPVLWQQLGDSLSARPIEFLSALEAVIRLLFFTVILTFIASAAWRFAVGMKRWFGNANGDDEAGAERQRSSA